MHSVKVHWVMGLKQKQWVSEEVFQNIIHIQTYNWTMYALCWFSLSGGIQAEAMARRRSFMKHCTHSNIHLNKAWLLCKYTEWWASSRSNGFQKKFFKTLYTFKHTIEQCMRSVDFHWVVGFKQKQWLAEEVLWNNIHIQTCNWTKYALCESTLSSGLQAAAMSFRGSFLKHYTHSNIQLNKVCILWKLHWVVGFKQNQWVSEEVFQNFIQIQTYNWTMYALCESTLSCWLRAEAMAFRRSFSTHYSHSNIQLNKVCALWKFTECWDSSRSNGSQKTFF